ncbi:hypothetical protein [Streptomyces viridochromogenes]|uniref:hypothetical protein n=1 Tax=Streptomyces viridochromogenes TaxID=1938 RepID=UPI000AABB8B0
MIACEERPGDQRLVAYVVPRRPRSEPLVAGERRARLAKKLPAYLVPTEFVEVLDGID